MHAIIIQKAPATIIISVRRMSGESALYKCCAELFATWLRIQALMIIVILACVVNLALSGVLFESKNDSGYIFTR